MKLDRTPIIPVELEERRKYGEMLLADMREKVYMLTETAFTALIRICSKCKESEQAEKWLSEAVGDKHIKKRNRLFSDVMGMYVGRASEALRTPVGATTRHFQIARFAIGRRRVI